MQSVFDQMGGAPAVRALVERFYDLVETAPEGAQILNLHLRGHGVAHARAEQFDFLSGFLGGPRIYAENHGHMNLRAIHAHVPIRPEDAKNWLLCMARALHQTGVAAELQAPIMATLGRAARMLINQEAVPQVSEAR